MTITYINGIPATNDNPSVDQPNMQLNTDAITTYVAIDHIPFNSDTAPNGMHAKVTFPLATSDPSLSNSQTQIYPKTFGSTTTYLETYEAVKTSAGNQINGYAPIVKAMAMFTCVGAGFPATLSLITNSLAVNVASVSQTDTQHLIVTFTTALPYATYYVFFFNNPGFTVVRSTGSFTLSIASGSLSGDTIGFMVI